METRLITDGLDTAAAIIAGGGLVAVPTETVYGLAADGRSEKAVEKIYAVKGRPESKPLSLMVPDAEAMDALCEDVPSQARALAGRFWPGPLTIVLKAKAAVPEIVRAGGSTVGLRCPAQEKTLELLKKCGCPLAAPSANPSGLPSPKTAAEVLNYFDGKIDAVIDGGECAVGRESTLIDMSRTPYRVLRAGAVSGDEIADALADGLFMIGITGGSGAGKTTALDTLASMGALCLDFDAIYHELTRTSDSLRRELCARFGESIYRGNVLDRKALGKIVFADENALADLNAITHRHIGGEAHRRMREYAMNGGTVVACDAIALIESGMAQRCGAIAAVIAPRELRLRRIMEREGISEEYAKLRINAQKTDDYYIKNSTLVLYNDGTRDEFAAKCSAAFKEVIENGRKA